MSPSTRKERTEALLREKGIPYFPGLPCIESEEETELRPAEEVGLRMLCLLCAIGTASPPLQFIMQTVSEALPTLESSYPG